MPMSEDEVKGIKTMIAVAKRKPINIGVCFGKDPEDTVIRMDRTRKPDALVREAKGDGETNRTVGGQIQISGKDATITTGDSPPGGFAKQLKLAFKEVVSVSLNITFVAAER